MQHPIIVLDPRHTGALKLRYYPAHSLPPGVSAWMILTHLALMNGLTAAELNSLLWPAVKDHKSKSFDYALNRPRWRISHPGTPLKEAYSSLEAAKGFSTEHLMAGYQETCLRYCAECLSLGIHVLIFQWTFIAVCPLHCLPLVTHCRKCHQPVAYRFNADTFKLPGHCPHCFNALLSIASVDRLNRRPQKIFQSLLAFTCQLNQALQQCQNFTDLAGLSNWFRVFPASYPTHQTANRPSSVWLFLVPSFFRSHGEPTIVDIQHCYRIIRRKLWCQFTVKERKQLYKWGRSQPGSIVQPVPSPLNRLQATYLFWRMVWEGRTKPGSLFQRSLAPYTGIGVWRLINVFEEEQEDNEESSSSHSKEIQSFNEALNQTYQVCDQLARRTITRNQICFDRNWVEIKSNILPSSPFFQIRSKQPF